MDAPQFDYPFRLKGRSFATVEQGTPEDVANCVRAVLGYHPGQRDMLPGFGCADLTFKLLPMGPDIIVDAVSQWEPRARVQIEENSDYFGSLIDRIVVEISQRENS